MKRSKRKFFLIGWLRLCTLYRSSIRGNNFTLFTKYRNAIQFSTQLNNFYEFSWSTNKIAVISIPDVSYTVRKKIQHRAQPCQFVHIGTVSLNLIKILKSQRYPNDRHLQKKVRRIVANSCTVDKVSVHTNLSNSTILYFNRSLQCLKNLIASYRFGQMDIKNGEGKIGNFISFARATSYCCTRIATVN